VKKFQELKSVGKTFDHPVVFDHLSQLDSTSLVAEATDILVAGSDTTATTLAVALHQLAYLPEVYTALKNELQRADLKTSDDYDLTRIEQFPYLVGAIPDHELTL
jgi:cytochrome P450